MSFKSKLLKSILKRSSSQKCEARMKTDTVMRVRTQANFELMTHPTGHSSVQRQGFWSHQVWAGKSECHLHNNVRFSSFGQRFRLFLYHQGESLCRMVRFNTVCWHKQQLYVSRAATFFMISARSDICSFLRDPLEQKTSLKWVIKFVASSSENTTLRPGPDSS